MYRKFQLVAVVWWQAYISFWGSTLLMYRIHAREVVGMETEGSDIVPSYSLGLFRASVTCGCSCGSWCVRVVLLYVNITFEFIRGFWNHVLGLKKCDNFNFVTYICHIKYLRCCYSDAWCTQPYLWFICCEIRRFPNLFGHGILYGLKHTDRKDSLKKNIVKQDKRKLFS